MTLSSHDEAVRTMFSNALKTATEGLEAEASFNDVLAQLNRDFGDIVELQSTLQLVKETVQ